MAVSYIFANQAAAGNAMHTCIRMLRVRRKHKREVRPAGYLPCHASTHHSVFFLWCLLEEVFA
jgi:hypothetical protein